jgi:hypothetical protein
MLTWKEIGVHFTEMVSYLKKVIQNQMKLNGCTLKIFVQKELILNLSMMVLHQLIAFKELLVIAG